MLAARAPPTPTVAHTFRRRTSRCIAQWTALPNHTVTFDANGGTGTMSNQVANVPTALDGQRLHADGLHVQRLEHRCPAAAATRLRRRRNLPFAADATLYAQWTALPNHTVTFDANGGTGTMSAQAATCQRH